MANKEFAKYAAAQTWETTGGDFENAPDGDYIGLLARAEVKKSGSNFWMLAVQIKICEVMDEAVADFIGKTHYVNAMFEGKNGWNPWKVKALFKELGLELPEMSDVEDVLQELIDASTGVVFKIKTKGEFTNTQIIEVLEEYADPSDGTQDASEEGAAEEEVEAASFPSDEEVDAFDKDAAAAFAEENGIELASKMLSKIKAQIKTWIAEQATEEVEEVAEEVEGDDPELKEKFIEFAASAGLTDINEDTTIAEAIEILKEYSFKEEELSDEEKQLLLDNGLGEIIVLKPKVVAKPVAKSAPAKVVAKPVAKSVVAPAKAVTRTAVKR